MADTIETFLNEIDLTATRVVTLPKMVLVLGGRTGVQPNDLYASNRNIFVTRMLERSDELAPFLCMPEDYKEWNQFNGYPHLVEFERDAGCLARVILLFSESEGAIAELASFANDPVLCERLVIVINRRHYNESSYITLGPVLQAKSQSDSALCVIESEDSRSFESEISDVAAALRGKFQSQPAAARFDPQQRRDRLLLIADLIELCSALSLPEIQFALERASLNADRKTLERELKLLEMFGLVASAVSDRQFYLPPSIEKRQSYLNYQSASGAPNFDRARVKAKFFSSMLHDRPRQKAYRVIHGGAA